MTYEILGGCPQLCSYTTLGQSLLAFKITEKRDFVAHFAKISKFFFLLVAISNRERSLTLAILQLINLAVY